jgi:hypothetical protein
MKAILEFELPDDQAEFDLATRGPDLQIVMNELLSDLRSIWKYGEEGKPSGPQGITPDEAERFRDFIWEHLDHKDLRGILEL